MLWRLLTLSSGSWRRLTAPKLSTPTAQLIISGGSPEASTEEEVDEMNNVVEEDDEMMDIVSQ